MGLRTPEQYVEDLRKQRREIYVFGKRVEGDWIEHPFIKPVVNANKLPYVLAQEEKYQELMTTKSTLIGEKISRFVQLHVDSDHMLKRLLANRELQLRHGTCHASRCMGTHGINPTYAITYDMDQKLGTDYHKRFTKWLENIHERDQSVTMASADARGDRSKSPSKQADLDAYVHIVERRSDGIVIRGAKAHQSGAIVADWHLVVPYSPPRPGEEDFAIDCAVPADDKGIVHISEWPSPLAARLQEGADIDLGIPDYGLHGSSLVIFNNVFVPYENVFMNGEVEFTAPLINRLSNLQMVHGMQCKAAFIELMVGAAATIAEYNGLDWRKTAHIRDKIIDIMSIAARIRAASLGAVAVPERHPSGVCFPDNILANSVKLLMAEGVTNAGSILVDVAGGSIATLPSERDLKSPATGEYVKKYLQGAPGVSTENRMRMMRFCEYLYGGSSTVRVPAIFGGGGREVEKLKLRATANIDELKDYAKKLARIQE